VCVCVCVCVCGPGGHTHTLKHRYLIQVILRRHHTHKHTHTHTYRHTLSHTGTLRTPTLLRRYLPGVGRAFIAAQKVPRTYACVCVCVFVCVYIYPRHAYTHTDTHTRTHTHTHTHIHMYTYTGASTRGETGASVFNSRHSPTKNSYMVRLGVYGRCVSLYYTH